MLIQPISSFSFHAQHIERDNADKNTSSTRKNALWSRSYCFITTGGATIDVIKKYIENQKRP